ncbi:hypothetical protein [Geodermatophilus obscurus]|uniref:Uncharacterized protein n=1 Tax=Geodermatophilus obscurus (strain ATCC 25078 / DSM 43160 / JCM 3152 / CCUG 61914 / KCC A-0152 / KCTC 9177 / NBRC 13315 / NRRL B-3577 / G-20) TaxID=526225 RepID=D2SBQ1_GEOOG|nr:hypothetical protein [Geodermatophilus obscurus]ADB76158.1 hypothetical protein Gobs_3570 [Geodermatophilus obscurus DSM 43160]
MSTDDHLAELYASGAVYAAASAPISPATAREALTLLRAQRLDRDRRRQGRRNRGAA